MAESPDEPSAAMTLADLLDQLGRRFADHSALIEGDQHISFAALSDRSRQLAKGLAAAGVSRSTHLGILMPNCADWIASAFAAWRLGATIVPLNTLLRAPELQHVLRLGDVSVLLMADRFLRHDYVALIEAAADVAPGSLSDRARQPIFSRTVPSLRQVILHGERRSGACHFEDLPAVGRELPDAWLESAQQSVAIAEPAAIFFTSGSTALPKGVLHTHASMLTAARNIGACLGLDGTDRVWGYLPFFFTGGLVAVALGSLARGAGVILQKVFDAAETLALLQRHHCTTFFGWPHQAEALINHADFASTALRLCKGVGAQTTWAERLFQPDHGAVGTWGMTETGPMAAATRYDDSRADRCGAYGRAMPGVEFCISDPERGCSCRMGEVGELCVRGSTLMDRYYGMARHECFDAQGFFHTGDLASLDARGLLHFVGRLKDVIKTAGVNVAAAEVEAALMRHPTVKLAYVVGMPHPGRGENVAAFVVSSADNQQALLEFCAARLASYKVPRHLFLVEEADIPILGSGKVDKQKLRQIALQLASASIGDLHHKVGQE